jgi:tRNA pseudouridine38-40 synthase
VIRSPFVVTQRPTPNAQRRRIRLLVQYDGTDFHGFQRQPERRTVQGELEEKLSKAFGERVEVTAAGRTDAGVHASGQVVHCDVPEGLPIEKVAQVVSSLLTRDVVVKYPEEIDEAFSARFSAARRTYHYYITREQPSPFAARYVVFVDNLRADTAPRMREAVRPLLGRHDFRSFCQAAVVTSTVRTLLSAEVSERGPLVRIALTADAFLWNMTRIVAGMLIEVGRGRLDTEALGAALAARDRRAAGVTAPPHGLFLARVEYPDGYPQGRSPRADDWDEIPGRPAAEAGSPDWR